MMPAALTRLLEAALLVAAAVVTVFAYVEIPGGHW